MSAATDFLSQLVQRGVQNALSVTISYIGGDRNQTLLLPAAVDDYVGQENPVRFIETFVNQCDLQKAGFRRVQPNDTGRPVDGASLQFHPRGEHRGRREPPQSGVKEVAGFRRSPHTIAALAICHAALGNGDRSPGIRSRQMPLAGAFLHGLERL